jgi:dethiobiotin synthetase
VNDIARVREAGGAQDPDLTPRQPIRRGLFVTGTSTGVGKTVVSAALMHRYRKTVALRYWKPIQTGIEQDDDTAEVARLGECRAEEVVTWGIRLPRPVSPHLAARLEGTTIEIGPLVASTSGALEDRAWIIEGAGGVLVPINDRQTIADVAIALALPVVVVATTTLGTINHTLLTLEALRQRALDVAGVIMVGDENQDNRAAIEKYGDVAVLGEMPRLTPLTPASVAEWSIMALDREGRLVERLR